MRRLIVGAVMGLAAMAVVIPADAAVYEGTVELTCTDFTAADTGALVLDRDNTGVGNEALRIEVTDGSGTVLYQLETEAPLDTYADGLRPTTSYTTPPAVNPIVFRLVSLAGNGLPEQVVAEHEATCAGLPSVTTLPDEPTTTAATTGVAPPAPSTPAVGATPRFTG